MALTWERRRVWDPVNGQRSAWFATHAGVQYIVEHRGDAPGFRLGVIRRGPRYTDSWSGGTYDTAKAARAAAAHRVERVERTGTGQARSRGGSSLAVERERRIADAKSQPRTPNRARFWYRLTHRAPRPKRRPLDQESREYWQDKDYELEQHQVGVRAEIRALDADLKRDVYDRGGKVSRASIRKQNVKARDPFGNLYSARETTNTSLYESMRRKLTGLRHDLTAATRERAEIATVLKYGELPGHYRRRIQHPRRRGRR